MTLNITVLTDTQIFQSSDFRLSRQGVPLPRPAMKLVRLSYPTFHGLVCYTGLATEDDSHADTTATLLVQWLEQTANTKFFQVVETIRSQASRHIAEVEQRSGTRHPLTFVAAAFIENKARLATISNFENIDGQISMSPGPELVTSWEAHRPGESPRVIVTGNKRAAPAAHRDELAATVAAAGEDSGRIRHEIKALNRWAAQSNSTAGDISEECTVASIDSSGSGSQQIDPTPGLEILDIMNGFHLSMADTLASIGAANATVVGASYGTNSPSTRRVPECQRILTDTRLSGYKMTEIFHGINLDCSPLGIDGNDAVFGSHSLTDDRSHCRFWRWSIANEDEEELDYLDVEPSMSAVGCANLNGDVALITGEIGRLQPIVIRSGQPADERRLLEVPDEMGEPAVSAINLRGEVCGSIAINQDNTDGNRVRPAFWDAEGALHIPSNLRGGTHGLAVHTNRHGQVLVWAQCGVFGRIAVIWNPLEDETFAIPGEIIPCYLSDDGHVVGFDRRDGRDAPVISYDYTNWTPQPVQNGYQPSAYNSLAIAGNVEIDGFRRVWHMDSGRPAALLPTWMYHNAVARAMNEAGNVVGQLATDNEQHVVIWTRTERD